MREELPKNLGIIFDESFLPGNGTTEAPGEFVESQRKQRRKSHAPERGGSPDPRTPSSAQPKRRSQGRERSKEGSRETPARERTNSDPRDPRKNRHDNSHKGAHNNNQRELNVHVSSTNHSHPSGHSHSSGQPRKQPHQPPEIFIKSPKRANENVKQNGKHNRTSSHSKQATPSNPPQTNTDQNPYAHMAFSGGW